MLIAGDDHQIPEQRDCIDITLKSLGAINFGPDGWTIRVCPALARQFDEIAAREIPRLKGSFAPVSPEEQHGIDLYRAAHCTLDWSPVILYGGPYPFSYDNALRLYRHLPFVFRAVHRTIIGQHNGEASLCA